MCGVKIRDSDIQVSIVSAILEWYGRCAAVQRQQSRLPAVLRCCLGVGCNLNGIEFDGVDGDDVNCSSFELCDCTHLVCFKPIACHMISLLSRSLNDSDRNGIDRSWPCFPL